MTKVSNNNNYRPQFHFTPPANWMNDPNGMVYFEGEYHLFYQYHPGGSTWGPMHWGHAVSTDLVHWQHLPIALAPDRNGMIFSGSAVVDWEDSSGFFGGVPGLVAIFTHADEYPESNRPRQRQSLAYSIDRGRTWKMYEENPVLCNEQLTDFRDPKVFWHGESKRWVMVLAAGDRVHLYTSKNLKQWSFASDFGAFDGSHDGVWECPDLIELPIEGSPNGESRWMLIVSIGDKPGYPEGTRTQYFIGHFDGSVFTNEYPSNTVLWLDYGRDNYAGVTWSDTPDPPKKYFIGWMSNWRYANVTPTGEWRSAMTLPRLLNLKHGDDGIRLVQEPVPYLEKLRKQPWEKFNVLLQSGDNLLASLQEDVYELVCDIEVGTAAEIGFKLRKGENEETIVGYRTIEQQLYLDRTRSGETVFHDSFPCKHAATHKITNGRLHLRIFVDQCSVEVFAGDGEVVLTDLIYPNPASRGLELFVRGGKAQLISFQLYPLHSIL